MSCFEIMWKKYFRAGEATVDNIIQRMRILWWITKATKTHSEYVTLTTFPLQRCLLERASLLRYTYIARLVFPHFTYSKTKCKILLALIDLCWIESTVSRWNVKTYFRKFNQLTYIWDMTPFGLVYRYQIYVLAFSVFWANLKMEASDPPKRWYIYHQWKVIL